MGLRGRALRHKRIRKKAFGTNGKPRLCVFRSLSNLTGSLIDDVAGKTLCTVSTVGLKSKNNPKYGGNVKAAVVLGEELAKKAVEKGITQIVFDRAGYKYHGRVKALAESCRKHGLKF
ncbi:MAG: 50S ribosomal protein L18 [Candidatus Omnitrophota bacterium]